MAVHDPSGPHPSLQGGRSKLVYVVVVHPEDGSLGLGVKVRGRGKVKQESQLRLGFGLQVGSGVEVRVREVLNSS